MSASTPERLAYMVNQIAANLAHEADPVAAVAAHIGDFWTPAMQQRLLAAGLDDLSPVARAAMERFADAR